MDDDVLYRSMGRVESGEAWNVFSGDYSKPIFPDEFGSQSICGSEDYSGRKRPEELQGVEITLKKVIDSLLKYKKDKPAIVFDYGGGVGISWCRLALNYLREIETEKLIMVVSNIESFYDPRYAVSTHFRPNDLRSMAFYQAQEMNLVQWIVAEPASADYKCISSLRQFILKGDFPLNGNVDLLFSRMSLVHSHIPDLHVHRLVELLSDRGIFIEASSYRQLPTLGDDEKIETSGGTPQRIKEIFAKSYKESINFYHLEKINRVEDGPNKGKPILYTILRKKSTSSPSIWA